MRKAIPFLMLFCRLILFATFQGLLALVFVILDSQTPWQQSEGYWVASGLLTNILIFIILNKLYGIENGNYFEGLKFIRADWWKDLLIALGIFLLSIPISTFPNIILSRSLFGSENIASQLFFRPLPTLGIIIGFIWAISQGLVELPTYFSYIMPRIEKNLKNSWIAWIIASFFLALQHITLPLLFNIDFILWRFGMFLPFAFFVGLCLKLRPRLFPYLMISHSLMNISVVVMLIQVS